MQQLKNSSSDLFLSSCSIEMTRYSEPVFDNSEQLICMTGKFIFLYKDLENIKNLFIIGPLKANLVSTKEQNPEYKELLKKYNIN
jgi:hypothetical protein